ncbi:MAG: zinc-binding alcohol dehydrogenase [Clostridia bacterium]|nr:zinc-binding alcohol dehydrogenase [Clostridia bacterium]
MINPSIIFPKINTAELVDAELPAVTGDLVKIRTAFTTVSPGTERANIIGSDSVQGRKAANVTFPRSAGYSASGIVEEVGEAVTDLVPGDRVIGFWTKHKRYNVIPAARVVKIPDGISFSLAAQVFVATFPMAAIRKCRVEAGEPVLVMGLGLLGQYAVALLRAAGAVPIVAVDPVASRREQALAGGADYAFDPFEEGFADRVKAVTGGGAAAAIEVTGVGAGLDGALDCMRRFGRVALLGCTRDKNFSIDYYRKVHCPGITMIGAHTNARPEEESHPGYFTHRDDIEAILKLLSFGRVSFSHLSGESHSPADCAAVYDRLIHDKNFPSVVQFDWLRLQ